MSCTCAICVGSELYSRDVPLSRLAGAFSSSEIRRFRRSARRLNATRRGDQAAFYLQKTLGRSADAAA